MHLSRMEAGSTRHRPSVFPPPRTHRRMNRRTLVWSAFLPLIIMGTVLLNWAFLVPTAFAAPAASSSASGQNTIQQFLQQGQQSQANRGQYQRLIAAPKPFAPLPSTKANVTSKRLPSAEPAKMKEQTYQLDDTFVLHRPATKAGATPKVQGSAIPAGSTPLIFKGSDGRLEIDLPRGSLDFTHASLADGSTPVGQFFLQIQQISGHAIAADSILGTYQIQIVDSQGQVVQGVVLTHPATIVYHYQQWEMQDLDLNPNEIMLSWPDLLAAARQAKQSTAGMVIPLTNDASAHTLTAQTSVLSGSLTASGSPEIASPAIPDLYEVSGNSGQYSYSYPLAVAPGPAGFAPQLQLSYSSQSTNQRYSRRAPAGDEGEGFSLSLGSITSAQYPSTSAGGAATWYSLNGVDGVSDKLIPIPNQSGYYETQHISHLLIHYTGSCWDVWGKDGTFEQLGCSSDSLQKNSTGTYDWDTNAILAPYNDKTQVKMIRISYLQDSPSSGVIRDAGIKQIQYGLADLSNNASWTQVIGTVDFHYHMPAVPSGQSAFATAYGNNYNCASAPPSTTTLRCDDPAPYNNAAVGLQPAPDVMATMSLDSITSYIGSDSTGHPAYTYTFTYQDYPYTTGYYTSYALIQESAAGEHLLKSITPTVYLNGTAHTRKPVVFGYTGNLQDVYRDPSQKVQNGSQQYGGQTFWQYLNFYQDQQTGTGARISYAEAFGNTHGTPDATDSSGNIIDDRFDPLFCDNHPTCNGVYLHPEDYSWSTQVVTQISALGTDSSGNTTVATTQYYYGLASIDLSNMPVSSCNPITGSGVPDWEADCVGDNWVPATSSGGKDGDWMDYYHAEFRGFNNVQIISPSNDLTVDWYISTAGWWTPASWSTNYNSGQLFQEDVYQGTSQAANTWLSDRYRNYPGNSNYPDLELCDTSTNVVYTPCVVGPLTESYATYDGNKQDTTPWTVTTYTYDDISTSTGYISTGYHNLTQEVTTSANMPTLTQKWSYAITNVNNNWQYYTVDKPIHSEIDDANGHVWNCQDITYDEGAPSGVPIPDAGLVTTVKAYSTCGNSSTALTSYIAYDQYGNVVATVDPLAVANASLYSGHGCSASNVVDLSAAWTAGRFTSCTTYDTANTAALPVTQTNALGQTSSIAYDYTSGALPTSVTDANGQISGYSVSYDSNGNETISVKQPGETGAYTTQQSEATSCTSSSTLPCYEIDANSLLYPNAISRTFYDQQGRAIETRTPGPTPGDDTIVETVYNDQNHTVWKSVPFQVADGSGWLDPTTTTDMNGNLPAGTTTFYDALGRVLATQDPNFGSTQEPGIACSTVLTGKYTACTNYSWGQALGDSNQYAITTNVDANGHVTASFTDTAGQVRYTQTFSGVYGGTPTPIRQTQTQYNALGEPTSVAVVDENPQSGQSVTGVSTTATYDDLGRLLTLNDPDQGTFSYTYDPDGHVLAATQTSGPNSRTIGMNYDLLGRVGCEQTAAPTINWNGACSAGNPLVQNTYDTTEIGTQGSTDFPVGHLTQSIATTYFPDSTSATTTDQFQYDQRGRTTTAQMQLSLPASWGVSTVLPVFQLMQAYNDANQPTTTNTNASGYGYTFTQVYDATTGVQTGLSNNAGTTANLATLAYNVNALPSQISFQTSTGGSGLATEQFGYDGDLRPTSTSAVWSSGSGQSGSLFNQTRTYDNAGNVTSLTTTQAQIQGQSASGGSQTENYCYDEQDRLLWAGNSGTQPGAGNGTCGAGTLGNTLSGAGYSSGYAYTNLGQLWQGPAAGSGQLSQYLYCDSAHPHRLTGIYPLGTTCANPSGATYAASYDPWGNMTSRTFNNVTATLSYDTLNHLVQWSAGSAGQQQYVYDASGQRVLTRTASGSTPGMTVYAFGLQELQYHTDGTPVGGTSNSYYYSLGGRIIGKFDGANTIFFISDGLGSIVASFSNTAGSAAVLGNQTYEPYGKQQYQQGSLGTSKGYTGQYNDSLSGLDYYNARYYDPVGGQFLSPDDVQGNSQGMDPYSYVGGNPETDTDPTGEFIATGTGAGGSPPTTVGPGNPLTWPKYEPKPVVPDEPPKFGPFIPFFCPCAPDTIHLSLQDEIRYGLVETATPVMPNYIGEGTQFARNSGAAWVSPFGDILTGIAATAALATLAGGGRDAGKPPIIVASSGNPCSFTPDTQVMTDKGEKPIGDLQVGDKVMAYNPKTHRMEAEPILHVWTHVDSDLIDLTITIETPAHDGKSASKESEVIHTTSEHPFLTKDQGFAPAGKLKVGTQILRADGSIGTITTWKQAPGTKVMYNLEVNQDHTFAVGAGEWVVHNKCDSQELRRNLSGQGINGQPGQQAHHITPCALENHPIVRVGGIDLNDPANGRFMWDSAHGANALQDGEPYHANSWKYLRVATELMNDAWLDLVQAGRFNSPLAARAAWLGVINDLNQFINGLGALSTLANTLGLTNGPCNLGGDF